MVKALEKYQGTINVLLFILGIFGTGFWVIMSQRAELDNIEKRFQDKFLKLEKGINKNIRKEHEMIVELSHKLEVLTSQVNNCNSAIKANVLKVDNLEKRLIEFNYELKILKTINKLKYNEYVNANGNNNKNN